MTKEMMIEAHLVLNITTQRSSWLLADFSLFLEHYHGHHHYHDHYYHGYHHLIIIIMVIITDDSSGSLLSLPPLPLLEETELHLGGLEDGEQGGGLVGLKEHSDDDRHPWKEAVLPCPST